MTFWDHTSRSNTQFSEKLLFLNPRYAHLRVPIRSYETMFLNILKLFVEHMINLKNYFLRKPSKQF